MKASTQNKLIKISRELSQLTSKDVKLHFSFILKRDNILSIGMNDQNKTDPLSFKLGHRYAHLHSEISAIKKYGINHDYSKCSLVNVRILRDFKTVVMSKPCDICFPWLLELPFPFKEIYYTDKNGVFLRI